MSFPWKVPFPVSAWLLWSTLSATHCMNGSWFPTVFMVLLAIAECLNNLTSSQLIEKPNPTRWSAHHVAHDLTISTPIPNGIGAIINFGLDLYEMQCPILVCFNSDKTRWLRKIFELSLFITDVNYL